MKAWILRKISKYQTIILYHVCNLHEHDEPLYPSYSWYIHAEVPDISKASTLIIIIYLTAKLTSCAHLSLLQFQVTWKPYLQGGASGSVSWQHAHRCPYRGPGRLSSAASSKWWSSYRFKGIVFPRISPWYKHALEWFSDARNFLLHRTHICSFLSAQLFIRFLSRFRTGWLIVCLSCLPHLFSLISVPLWWCFKFIPLASTNNSVEFIF